MRQSFSMVLAHVKRQSQVLWSAYASICEPELAFMKNQPVVFWQIAGSGVFLALQPIVGAAIAVEFGPVFGDGSWGLYGLIALPAVFGVLAILSSVYILIEERDRYRAQVAGMADLVVGAMGKQDQLSDLLNAIIHEHELPAVGLPEAAVLELRDTLIRRAEHYAHERVAAGDHDRA